MVDLSEAVTRQRRRDRYRARPERKGQVTAIDSSTSPDSYTLNTGRTMPCLDSTVVKGDVVVYLDGRDPYIVGKFVDTV